MQPARARRKPRRRASKNSGARRKRRCLAGASVTGGLDGVMPGEAPLGFTVTVDGPGNADDRHAVPHGVERGAGRLERAETTARCPVSLPFEEEASMASSDDNASGVMAQVRSVISSATFG